MLSKVTFVVSVVLAISFNSNSFASNYSGDKWDLKKRSCSENSDPNLASRTHKQIKNSQHGQSQEVRNADIFQIQYALPHCGRWLSTIDLGRLARVSKSVNSVLYRRNPNLWDGQTLIVNLCRPERLSSLFNSKYPFRNNSVTLKLMDPAANRALDANAVISVFNWIHYLGCMNQGSETDIPHLELDFNYTISYQKLLNWPAERNELNLKDSYREKSLESIGQALCLLRGIKMPFITSMGFSNFLECDSDEQESEVPSSLLNGMQHLMCNVRSLRLKDFSLISERVLTAPGSGLFFDKLETVKLVSTRGAFDPFCTAPEFEIFANLRTRSLVFINVHIQNFEMVLKYVNRRFFSPVSLTFLNCLVTSQREQYRDDDLALNAALIGEHLPDEIDHKMYRTALLKMRELKELNVFGGQWLDPTDFESFEREAITYREVLSARIESLNLYWL